MKKRLLAAALLLALAVLLTGCGKDDEPEDVPPIDPAVTEIIPDATFQPSLIAPTLPPDETITWVGLASDSFGISLTYPSSCHVGRRVGKRFKSLKRRVQLRKASPFRKMRP